MKAFRRMTGGELNEAAPHHVEIQRLTAESIHDDIQVVLALSGDEVRIVRD